MTSQEDRISDTAEHKFTTKGLEPKLLTPTEETAQTFASFFPMRGILSMPKTQIGRANQNGKQKRAIR